MTETAAERDVEFVVSETRIDPDKMMFQDLDRDVRQPVFTVNEVAKTFFARTSFWMRMAEREGWLVYKGTPIVPARTAKNAREYRLGDVERIAHSLATQGKISGAKLRNILLALRAVADIWEIP